MLILLLYMANESHTQTFEEDACVIVCHVAKFNDSITGSRLAPFNNTSVPLAIKAFNSCILVKTAS